MSDTGAAAACACAARASAWSPRNSSGALSQLDNSRAVSQGGDMATLSQVASAEDAEAAPAPVRLRGGRAQSSCALADMQPQQEEEDTGALILLVNEADKLVLESADADSASSFDVPAPVFLRSASRRSNSPACCSP